MFMIRTKPVLDFKDKFADIEYALDAADFDAKNNPARYTHEEVFDSIREKIKRKTLKPLLAY